MRFCGRPENMPLWFELNIKGNLFHEYLMNEIELGTRVADYIDEYLASGWDALLDLLYAEHLEDLAR